MNNNGIGSASLLKEDVVKKCEPPDTSVCNNMQSIANQGSLCEFQCPEFLLRFHLIGEVD